MCLIAKNLVTLLFSLLASNPPFLKMFLFFVVCERGILVLSQHIFFSLDDCVVILIFDSSLVCGFCLIYVSIFYLVLWISFGILFMICAFVLFEFFCYSSVAEMPRYDDRYGNTRLYVGRLSSRTRSRDLEHLFSRYGRL